MYQTILGVEGFNRGMKLYFERHDGQAVTCDDFLSAMADANSVNLSQFALWYSTPGTPTVSFSGEFKDGSYKLTLTQSSRSEKPLHIPVAVGLLDKETGEEVIPTTVIELKNERETFTFDGLKGDVIPSVLRDFSAPVKLVSMSDSHESDLAFLAARDTDGFNRWESGQKLYTSLIFETIAGKQSERTVDFVSDAFIRALMSKDTSDYSISAYTLMLPSESTLAEEMAVINPIAIHKACGDVKRLLAKRFQDELRKRYEELTELMNSDDEFKVDAISIGMRRFRNVVLDYLCSIRATEDEQIQAAELATNHFIKATGMTDKIAAFNCLASMDGAGASYRDKAVESFYEEADGDALVLNKWFSVQAMADLPDVLDRVKKLKSHPDFTMLNPNRCRSLIGAFTMNSAAFHNENGDGYKFISEMLIELDKINPQVSSRMAGSLIQWRRYDEKRGALMKSELETLTSLKLSDDLYEIVTRALK